MASKSTNYYKSHAEALKIKQAYQRKYNKKPSQVNGELNLMPKTEKEEPMAMAISWMSRINKEAEPSSKPKAKTEQETEVKRND